MNHVFFVSNSEWKQVREEQQFDYIIIGSAFCGYAFFRTCRCRTSKPWAD